MAKFCAAPHSQRGVSFEPLDNDLALRLLTEAHGDLALLVRGVLDESRLGTRGLFFRRSHRYGDFILKEGVWNEPEPPAELAYAAVPVAVGLNRTIEVTYHPGDAVSSLPVARAHLPKGQIWGGFELLDNVGQDLSLPRAATTRPHTQAWNLTAGTTAFRFFSNRRDYRRMLSALLPGTSRSTRNPKEVWTIELLKEKALKHSQQSHALQAIEVPEFRYLRPLEDKHHAPPRWSLDILYFSRAFMQAVLKLDTITKYLLYTHLIGVTWQQAKERRTYGDVASYYAPKLSKILYKAGARYYDKLQPLLFDFLLVCHGAQMGFRPLLEDEDLNSLSLLGPFSFYQHRELDGIKRPIILVPEFVDRGQPLVFPLSQPTPNGRLEPNSWEKDVYEPVGEALDELWDLRALEAEGLRIGFHYRPKSDPTVSRYWPDTKAKAPAWIREMDFDHESRCFLTVEMVVT